jgi:hypothetical protein
MIGSRACSTGMELGAIAQRLVYAAIVASALTLFPRAAHPAPDDAWDPRFYANGTGIHEIVDAVVVSGSNVYVAGSFSSMFGVAAANVARWDGSSWSALGTGTNNRVRALAVLGGELYAAGQFTTAGGVSANRIARWNGTSWSALGTGMNDVVFALAVSGSTLYAAGQFSTAGGSSANRIAQWNGSTWSALGTGMTGFPVRALAVVGSDLYAGGNFTAAGGVSASNIARWNGTAWAALGSGTNNQVTSLAIGGTDLYAGGLFTTAGGGGANRIARWDGATWSALGTGMNGTVLALGVAASDLYAEGEFSTAGGVAASSVARWNGTSWSALGTGIVLTNGFDNISGAVAAVGADVWVGAQFISAGGAAGVSLARWNGSTWSVATTPAGAGIASSGPAGVDFRPGIRDLARAASGDIYATGSFTFAGPTAAGGVARWDGTSWSALGTIGLQGSSFAGFGPTGHALAFYGGDVIVGGHFAMVGGVTVNHVARWNGATWSSLGTGVAGGSVVNALAVYNGELYAAGSFSTAGGGSGANIARWNGTSWSAVGTGTNGSVYALAVVGSDLYAGGAFTTAGGVSASRIARWDGTTWSALGAGLDGAVFTLAGFGGDVHAGGAFSNAISRWNGSTWSTVGGGICTFCGFGGHYVYALAAVGTDLYVGGSFDFVNGTITAASGIAKWNGAAWTPLGSGLGGCVGSNCFPGFAGADVTPGYGASALTIDGTDVAIGGRFTFADGKPSSYFVLWHNCGNGVVNPNEQCDDGGTANGDCCSSTCQFEANGGACTDDGNACTNDQCDGAGGCTHPNNTAPCTDGVFCNGPDVCGGGACSQHAGDPCPGPNGDGNCSESCDETGDTCTAPDPNGASCDDALFCNGTDTCDAGLCGVHAGDPCPGPDGDGNCSESCDEAGDTCTAADPNATPCTDALFCNGPDSCSGGACTAHAGDPCAGGPECANVCNEALDSCALPGSPPCTTDGNVCTDDHCDGAGACVHTANTAPCDDDVFCNGTDVCAGTVCTHGGDPCMAGTECANACNEAGDHCNDPSGAACTDDANPCTLDQCDGSGSCAHPAGNAGAVCRAAAGQCDATETCTGASAACPSDGSVPDGTGCTDGDACTNPDVCTGGACTSGVAVVCALCERCDTSGGCIEAPRTGCKQTTKPLKASILLQDRTPDDLDQVKWKWSSGEATTFAELGNPLTTDDYALCVYDSSSSLLFRMTAPAGGTCGTKPCWKQLGPPTEGKGYKYKDVDGLPDDLDSMTIKSGLDGKAKVSLKGKGVNVPMPALGALSLPLTTQLQSENGQCYEATTVTPSANTTMLFKAKAD